MAKKTNIGKKFLSNKLLDSDSFTFEWRVFRYKDQDRRAIEKDMVKTGLAKKMSESLDTLEEEKCKIQLRKIYDKHTKKWYIYSLYRYCHQQDEIVKALSMLLKSDKEAYAKKVESSVNYKLFQEVLAAEEKKNRKFSSLAAMQRYVDKHDLGIDVYSLMETSKKTTTTK